MLHCELLYPNTCTRLYGNQCFVRAKFNCVIPKPREVRQINNERSISICRRLTTRRPASVVLLSSSQNAATESKAPRLTSWPYWPVTSDHQASRAAVCMNAAMPSIQCRPHSHRSIQQCSAYARTFFLIPSNVTAFTQGEKSRTTNIGWLDSRVVSVLDSVAGGPGFKSQPRRCRVTVLGKLFNTHRSSVHQAAKLVAALLRVARVTAGLAESNGSLPPSWWLTSPTGWLPRTGISCRTLH